MQTELKCGFYRQGMVRSTTDRHLLLLLIARNEQ
jgi:hypothetical protein